MRGTKPPVAIFYPPLAEMVVLGLDRPGRRFRSACRGQVAGSAGRPVIIGTPGVIMTAPAEGSSKQPHLCADLNKIE